MSSIYGHFAPSGTCDFPDADAMKILRERLLGFALMCLGVSVVNAQILTTNNGAPVGDNQNSITAGENGPGASSRHPIDRETGSI